MLAARYRLDAAVSLLLDRGADPADLLRAPGDRPLVWAAARGDVALLKRIWERILTIAQRSDEGPDALLVAVRNGNRPAVEYLLSQRVDVNAAQTSPRMPAYLFDTALARVVISPKLTALVSPRPSLLTTAASSGDAELFRLLMAHGARPNAHDADGYTPFIAAVRPASGSIFAGQGGAVPLAAASKRAWRSIVEQLIAGGADVRAATKDGYTVLHSAAGDTDLVRLLIPGART